MVSHSAQVAGILLCLCNRSVGFAIIIPGIALSLMRGMGYQPYCCYGVLVQRIGGEFLSCITDARFT